MRILLTTDTVGGVWTFTCELLKELLRAGHHVALVSFGREPLPHQQQWCEDAWTQFGDHFVFQASDAPLEWMPQNERAFPEGARFLLDMCDSFAPDVLHSSQFCWGALGLSLPIVVTAHSDVLSWAEACRPNGLEESAWLDRYRKLVQEGLDGACAVTAPTQWMAEALQQHFRVPVGVRVVANGRSVAVRSDGRRLQAVSAGRLWDEAKGLHTILEMKSAMPVVIAGEASHDVEFGDAIRFAGALSAEEMLQLFSESSVYIVASLYEPFGLAPLEAALCGCAVIARDLPSLREVWGEAAMYFGNVQELESILAAFASDAELLESKRAASLQRAKSFSASKMASGYLELYHYLCSRRTEERCGHEVAAYAS